jgi:signal transduction histidine kinase
MADRVDALGGELRINSALGRGTQLLGSLPLLAAGVAA